MSNHFSLEGKVVLVTGSTCGLGWAAAQAEAQADARAILHGQSEEAGRVRKQGLEARGLRADFLPFDMSDRRRSETV